MSISRRVAMSMIPVGGTYFDMAGNVWVRVSDRQFRTDNGAVWEIDPFWQEHRMVYVEPPTEEGIRLHRTALENLQWGPGADGRRYNDSIDI